MSDCETFRLIGPGVSRPRTVRGGPFPNATSASMSTASELPDPALAPDWPPPGLRLAAADSLALDEVLRRAAPRLRRYASRRLGDAHEAEEVVQEALLRACQHAPGFATEDDLMAWTTVVTGRLVIDRLRLRNRSVSVAEVPDHTRLGRDTADVVVARDEARAALDALEAMPSRQAAVLWSREVEGLSYDAIAERFALSEPTVRSLLHRARRTLRREYAARGGTLPVAGLAVLAPWHGGLHGLARLRDAARQAFAPVTAGAAAVTVMGVAALFIGGGAGAGQRPPAVFIGPSQTASATTSAAAVAGPSSAAGTAAPTATGSSASVGGSGGSHGLSHPLRTPVCARTARTAATSGQAGVNCHYDSGTPALVIGIPVPNNPTRVKHIGVTSDKVNCRKVPNTPVARCVQQDQPSTTVSRN